jgi:predicted nucleotidyltransferase component of viral defense system
MYSLYNSGNETTTIYKSYEEICDALNISIYTVRRLYMYNLERLKKKPRPNMVTGDLYDTYTITKLEKEVKEKPVKIKKVKEVKEKKKTKKQLKAEEEERQRQEVTRMLSREINGGALNTDDDNESVTNTDDLVFIE